MNAGRSLSLRALHFFASTLFTLLLIYSFVILLFSIIYSCFSLSIPSQHFDGARVIQGLTDEELGLLAYWFALPPIDRFLLTSSGLQRVFAVRLSSTELRNTAFVALKIKSGIPEAELLKFHPMLVETLAAKHDRFTIPSEIRDSEKEMAAGMAQRADAAAGAALRAAGSDATVDPMTGLQAVQLSTVDQLFRFLCTEMIPLAMGCERHRASRAAPAQTPAAPPREEEEEVSDDHADAASDDDQEQGTGPVSGPGRETGAEENTDNSDASARAADVSVSEPAPEDLDDDDDV
jgi:hypothetical protein